MSLLRNFFGQAWLPYVLPFAVFLLFTEPARFFPSWVGYLYLTKTFVVALLLWFFRGHYAQDLSPRLFGAEVLLAVFCGLVVLLLWIVPETYLYQFDPGGGFAPYVLTESKGAALTLITVRLFGASIVVPLMEELFWRSFLMRYVIDANFRSVPLGAFSWLSFLAVAILFGLEHHRIVVGIVAGLLYGLLLIYQKKLRGVILAHGVTNLGLGAYVLVTRQWSFW